VAGFKEHVVGRLRERAPSITKRWLAILNERLSVAPVRIFPDETLLNHIPELLDRLLANLLREGAVEEDPLVQRELRALAALRRSQGYTLDELVIEFHALRESIHDEALDCAEGWSGDVPPREAFEVGHDLDGALNVILEVTSAAYRDSATQDREARAGLLAAFGRAITHELRSRLNNAVLALSIYRQRIEQGTPPHEADSLLDSLEAALDRLGGVAADVFAAMVSESRLSEAPGRRLPFDQLVRNTVDELAMFAEQCDVAFRIPDDLPSFQVDAPRLHLVLVNLFTNAIKYADPRKAEKWVAISATTGDEPGEWQVDVEDNGIGIDPALREHVFQRHLRSSNSEESGEGLGLALAHEAVSQLEGRLWVTGEPGMSSTFSFTLKEPVSQLTTGADSSD